MFLRFSLKTFGILLASFLLIELYYQLQYRLGSALPGFLRLYDFRYFDLEGTPRLPPNLSAWHRSYAGRPDVKIHINGEGFRGKEPLAAPSKRIVMIGDSTVFNGGVEDKESFPSLLEASLRNEIGDPGIEVLNFGVGDTNARQHFLKLKNHALAYSPQLVVVFIYLNDSIETPLASFDASPRSLVVPWHHSFAFENLGKAFRNISIVFEARSSGRFEWTGLFLSRRYLNDEILWKKLIEDAKFDWGAGWNSKEWNVIESSLAAMVEITRSQQVELWMAVLPVKPQVELPETAFGLNRPQELGKQVAERLNVKFLDPLPFLRSLKNADDLFYDHCHYTPLGNEAIAKFLAPHLEAWLEPVNDCC